VAHPIKTEFFTQVLIIFNILAFLNDLIGKNREKLKFWRYFKLNSLKVGEVLRTGWKVKSKALPTLLVYVAGLGGRSFTLFSNIAMHSPKWWEKEW